MKNIFLSVFLILILLTCATPNVIFADGPPWLGVNMKDSIDGVLIINVVKDSPAEAAGISVNDVIIGYHNRRIQTFISDKYNSCWKGSGDNRFTRWRENTAHSGNRREGNRAGQPIPTHDGLLCPWDGWTRLRRQP
jgi:hypothetical protein